MAHIREMIIESGKTLEEGGSYRKAGRTMTVAFEPGEWTVSAPPEDDDGNPGDWKPIVNALGKQLDIQVNEALGFAKESKRQERAGEDKPNPEDKPDFTIRDPESPMTPGQKEGIEKLMKIPGAPKLINTYRETHDIKDSWETANKGQASEIMDLLIQLGKQKKEGDKQ